MRKTGTRKTGTRKTIVATAAAASLVFTGCSATENSSANGAGAAVGGKDPCSLLTDDQLIKAYGKKPVTRKPTSEMFNGCSWSVGRVEDESWSGGRDDGGLLVYVNSRDSVERRITSDMEDLPNVGEKAAWRTGVIFAVAGDIGLHVLCHVDIGGSTITDDWQQRPKQVCSWLTRNVFAALGVGKPDDSPLAPATPTRTSSTTPGGPTRTTEPETTSQRATAPESSETTEN